jgi:hypothetical protein
MRPHQVVLEAGGAAVFATIAVLADDRPMLLLAGIAAVALALLTLRDVLLPVRLAADRDGVTLVRGFRRRRLAWPQVERIRLYESGRFGLTSRMLEIDTGDALYLLGTRDLGVPAEEVERELRAIRLGT